MLALHATSRQSIVTSLARSCARSLLNVTSCKPISGRSSLLLDPSTASFSTGRPRAGDRDTRERSRYPSKDAFRRDKNPHRSPHDQNNSIKGDPSSSSYVEISQGGAIEINPALCSGCGTPFQSSFPSSAGYLTKEKMAEHRQRMELRGRVADAMKVLRDAGIEVHSSTADEIFAGAGLSEDVVKALRKSEGGGGKEERSEGRMAHDSQGMGSSASAEAEGEVEVSDLQEAASAHRSAAESSLVNVCQRCYRLKQYGQLEAHLRPGWNRGNTSNKLASASASSGAKLSKDGSGSFSKTSQQQQEVATGSAAAGGDDDAMSPERFEHALQAVKDMDTVVLCLVDVFDLTGSVLRGLRGIAGRNTVVVGANKVDLLPDNVPADRLRQWIYDEVRLQCGMLTAAERAAEVEAYKAKKMASQGWFEGREADARALGAGVLSKENIHLISCSSGKGVKSLIASVVELAKAQGSNTITVLGTANVGKSSFINRLIDTRTIRSDVARREHGSRNSVMTKYKSPSAVPQTTVSNVPGTTLNTIRIALPQQGVTFVDTPGVLHSGSMTAHVATDELQYVIPRTPINRITHRVAEGKVVLMGGLARIGLTEGRPLFFTFFLSNDVKLHPTDATRATEVLQRHCHGGKDALINPPFSAQRLAELGADLVEHSFEVQGDSWVKGTCDIVIAGLGWVCITGPGMAKVTVTAPRGVDVTIRRPLLPFEAWQSTASFSGGRWIQRQKNGAQVNRKYGWRA